MTAPHPLSQGLDSALFCFSFLRSFSRSRFELARELEPDQDENVVNEIQHSTQSIALFIFNFCQFVIKMPNIFHVDRILKLSDIDVLIGPIVVCIVTVLFVFYRVTRILSELFYTWTHNNRELRQPELRRQQLQKH